MKTNRVRVQLTRPDVARRAYVRPTAADKASPPLHPTPDTCTPSPPKGGVGGTKEFIGYKENQEQETNVHALHDQVLSLDSASRQALLDKLAAAQMLDAGQDSDLQMWAVACSAALVSTLGGAGGAACGPVLAKRALGATASWSPVKAFCTQVGFDRLTNVERASAFQMLARLLLEHVKFVAHRSGAPLSLKLVANCAQNVAGAFDNAFPGYLHSRLAMLPFRQYMNRAGGARQAGAPHMHLVQGRT